MVTFGLDRVLFLRKLRIKAKPQPLTPSSWKALYAKLKLVEIPVEGKLQQ